MKRNYYKYISFTLDAKKDKVKVTFEVVYEFKLV